MRYQIIQCKGVLPERVVLLCILSPIDAVVNLPYISLNWLCACIKIT